MDKSYKKKMYLLFFLLSVVVVLWGYFSVKLLSMLIR